jgi:hypothetical protein
VLSIDQKDTQYNLKNQLVHIGQLDKHLDKLQISLNFRNILKSFKFTILYSENNEIAIFCIIPAVIEAQAEAPANIRPD